MSYKLSVINSRYRYGLVPYIWNSGRERWELPVGTVGAIDLRSLSAQAAVGGTPQGFAFAATRQPVSGGTPLSQAWHLASEPTTTAIQDKWQTQMGYRPTGNTLRDLLWDQLTAGADPTGANGPKPLLPNSQSVLELWLGGHSVIRREPFRWGVHPHTNQVQAVLHADFAAGFDCDPIHACRVLDFWCQQYNVDDWQEFVPKCLHPHVPGRIPHQTTFTESWPTNGTTISTGQDQPWNEDSNDVSVVSNHLEMVTGAARVFGRCTTNLSTADHKHTATITIVSGANIRNGNVTCRKIDSTAETYYAMGFNRNTTDFTRDLFKRVAGAFTLLAGDAVDAGAGGKVTFAQANGSSISGDIAGTAFGPITDTAITGNLQVGYAGRNDSGTQGDVQWDTHTAEDLAAAAAQVRNYQLMSCGVQ